MAIFYLNVITVSRSVGRNAVVAAAYCSRSRVRDRQRQIVADFSEFGDLEHSEILLPVGARAEWSDRATLWNDVEAVEKRDDAQVAREVEIAIPSELSNADGIVLAREFFNEQFVERGIIVDLNIHRASGADGVERRYVQALFSMREIVEEGFGKKRTDWKDSKLLSKWRERWTLLSNKLLLAAGCHQLIRAGADAVRGRALEPFFDVDGAERRAENHEIAWRNGERLLGEPDLVLRALTHERSSFSRREMIEFVRNNTAGDEQFDTALARVECSVELVRLADGESFSTRRLVAAVQCASAESAESGGASARVTTTDSARTLEEAMSLWERAGLTLRGVGLTYETAKAFEKKSGIKSVGGLCRKFLSQAGMGYDRRQRGGRNRAMIDFKGSHFERQVILWGVRWYVSYPMSYRQLEEMMEERGVEVDHSTLNRWVVKYAPLLENQFRARKRAIGSSWRLDETYVKVKGSWKYLYRAVDKAGATVDFLLTAKRDCKAALRFLRKAIGQHGEPEKITIDKSGANTAAIERYNAEHGADIEIRRIKYLNNIVEQDHRAVKRVTRPMLGFKSFRSAAATLSGIELMHMIRKDQLQTRGKSRPAQQFYALAA